MVDTPLEYARGLRDQSLAQAHGSLALGHAGAGRQSLRHLHRGEERAQVALGGGVRRRVRAQSFVHGPAAARGRLVAAVTARWGANGRMRICRCAATRSRCRCAWGSSAAERGERWRGRQPCGGRELGLRRKLGLLRARSEDCRHGHSRETLHGQRRRLRAPAQRRRRRPGRFEPSGARADQRVPFGYVQLLSQ
ncbi:hypothetical protein T492DRAFT_1039332 [Pavlovales sp. CCMP2436]|nr:hypothetical protein T492DRAFT_1039332 [Pavlovales sp. CCMP2436]